MKIKHIAAGLALLAMPFTAQAEVREAGLVDGFGMSLIYPAVHTKNIAAENAINKDITGYVRRMKELYESGEKQEVYMTYTTKYEDEDLVSIVLETSSINEGMADRNAQAYGLVYNKKTGDLLDKSKFGVKVDSAEVVNLLKEGKLDLYNINGKKLSYDSFFKPTAYMEAECFLLGLGGFTWAAFVSGAFLNAIPGIILQIVLIPAILIALRKGNLMLDE